MDQPYCTLSAVNSLSDRNSSGGHSWLELVSLSHESYKSPFARFRASLALTGKGDDKKPDHKAICDEPRMTGEFTLSGLR